MRRKPKIRLFVPSPLTADGTVALSADQAHYARTVMRARASEPVLLFNGADGEWLGSLVLSGRKEASIAVERQTRPQQAEPDIWLAFAPIKKARTDFIAQKLSELGASILMPVFTERTVAERVNQARMQANAIEAAEQCERLTIPTVNAPTSLTDLLAKWPQERALFFCDESLGGRPLFDAAQQLAGRPAGILIGPEGGFSPAEHTAITALPSSNAVTLGPRLLRADTAALAALSLWQAAAGDWR